MGAFSPGWEKGARPHPDCIEIMLGSDQRAMWGRKCPHCSGYWRMAAPGLIANAVCPYCGKHSAPHECACEACGIQTDILGRFGYCSTCGTRNDLAMLVADIEAIRAAVNSGTSPVTALKEAVDAFDSCG